MNPYTLHMTDKNNSDKIEYPMAKPTSVPIAGAPEATYASVSATQPAAPVSTESIQYIPPIQYEVTNHNPDSVQVTELMVKTYQYSGSVRCLSIFEIVILLLYSFQIPAAILLILFPLYGYYGSVSYDSCKTIVYFFYQTFSCITNVLIMSVAISDSKDDNKSNTIAFSLVNLCFNLYFAILIKTFLHCINSLSIQEITSLKVIRFLGGSPSMYRYW